MGGSWKILSLQEFFFQTGKQERYFSTRKVLLDVELIGYESIFLL